MGRLCLKIIVILVVSFGIYCFFLDFCVKVILSVVFDFCKKNLFSILLEIYFVDINDVIVVEFEE